jgi:hypothetical protein
MIRGRHPIVQRTGVLCAITLLLLPLLLGGHRHATDQLRTSDTCALCVVTHLLPAMTAPPLPQLAPPAVPLAKAAQVVAPPARLCHACPSGRAPPLSHSFRAV